MCGDSLLFEYVNLIENKNEPNTVRLQMLNKILHKFPMGIVKIIDNYVDTKEYIEFRINEIVNNNRYLEMYNYYENSKMSY